MTFLKTFTLILTVLFFSTPASALNQKYGNWKMTFKIAVKGLPVQLPPQTITNEQCLTKEHELPLADQEKGCTFKIIDKTDSTLKWQMNCKDKGLKGNGEMRYNGKTLNGFIKAQSNVQGMKLDMTTDITGQYLGPCK